MIRVTLRIPEELHQELVKSSENQNISLNSDLIRRLALSFGMEENNQESPESICPKALAEDIKNKISLLSDILSNYK